MDKCWDHVISVKLKQEVFDEHRNAGTEGS